MLYLLRKKWVLMAIFALVIAALVLLLLLMIPQSETFTDAWYV